MNQRDTETQRKHREEQERVVDLPPPFIFFSVLSLCLRGSLLPPVLVPHYQKPINFHHSIPTVLQMMMFGIDAISPSRHHVCCVT